MRDSGWVTDIAAPPLPRVLVVDDEESLAEVLASVLRRDGWTARTAYTGEEAVRRRGRSSRTSWSWT